MKTFFILTSILTSIFTFVSCHKSTGEYHLDVKGTGTIRQAPDFKKITEFVNQAHVSAQKKPNIYFIFFDTLRPDYALNYGKNFQKYYSESFSFSKAFGTAPATWYSTYSWFHAMPAFIVYNSVIYDLPAQEYYGSIFIKMLSKLDYKINSYGYTWDCMDKSYKVQDWDKWIRSFFGYNSRFSSRCNPIPTHEPIYDRNEDEKSLEKISTNLKEDVTSPEGHLSVINFYNNHVPYKWGSLPADQFITGSGPNSPEHITASPEYAENQYLNSVRASDINFGGLLKELDTLPGKDDAVVILLSDHGEMLFKNNIPQHGGSPYKENIRILFAMKFGKNSEKNKPAGNDALASIEDTFPTLFDYMGVTPTLPKEFSAGISLLSAKRTSVLTAKTALSNPTREMVLENNKYKAWITVADNNFYHSSAFTLKKWTDINDEPLREEDEPCFQKLDAECINILKDEFSFALKDMYPNFPN